jgi:polygalacturonase
MGSNMTYNFGNIEDTYRANVMIEFGAKGNGVTDDTVAINNALASGASQIFFPPGTYKVDGYVTNYF